MKTRRFYHFILMVMAAITLVMNAGCSSVPKEVVELSYTVGQDIEAVQLSYRALIQKHFQTLRQQAISFLDERWTPAYLKDFIEHGELLNYCQDRDPVKAFEGVSVWVQVAIEEIENKKKGLLLPIDEDERALLSSVDDAFARLIRANAMITAHLNSLRKVQEIQDEALQGLKLKDLRDKINQQLVISSERAQKAIEKVQKAQKAVDKVDRKTRK